MTEPEKKLMDLLKDAQYIKDGYGGYKIDEEDTFNAIIKAFPQITKKPVPIKAYSQFISVNPDKMKDVFEFSKEFIHDNKASSAWIESHFVEVIND